MANGDAIDIVELLLCGISFDDIQSIYPWVDEGFAAAVWASYLKNPRKFTYQLNRQYPVKKLAREDQERLDKVKDA